MDHEQLIKDVSGAITRLQMSPFNSVEGSYICRIVGKLCSENKQLLDDNMKLSEDLDKREDDISTEDLRDVLRYICVQRNQVPDVYFKIVKVVRERELPGREMTVEEIERALGHSIKIIK